MTESPAPTSSARFRRSLLATLVVLLVVAVGFLVYVFSARDVDALGLERGEISQSQDRGAVQSQARQFVLRLLNFGPELLDDNGRMPGYRKSVSELLTAKFNDSFQNEVESAEQLAAAGSSSKGEVYATGVTVIDPDSASVLVASSRVQTYPTTSGATVDSEVAAVRVVVQLVRTKGTWLVDDFAPVADPLTAEPTGVPTLAPEPTPTGGGTPAPTRAPTGQPSMTTLPPLPSAGGDRVSPSWYDILDVETDATADEIRAAWRRAIDGLDPTDRRFAVRNQAAAVLLDPARRSAYDAELTSDPDDADAPVEVEPAVESADRPAARTLTVEPAVTRKRTAKPVRAERPTPAGATATAALQPDRGAVARGVPGWLLTGLALVVALVAGLGGYLYAHSEPHDAVDAAAESARATAEKAVGPAFSYDYHDMEASRASAEAYMTDRFSKAEFDPVFSVLVENAPKIKPVVTASFVESGVTAADADRVDVLVAFDQTTRKAGQDGPKLGLLYATLRMVLVDGDWLIDDIITKPIGL